MTQSEAFGAVLSILAIAILLGLSIVDSAHALVPIDAVVSAAYAASIVSLLVSATLLHNQFRTLFRLPHAILANAFGSTALILIPVLVTMPRIVSSDGFGFGNDTMAWMWTAWHAFFALSIVAYAASLLAQRRRALPTDRSRRFANGYSIVSLTCVVVAVAIVLVDHAHLPKLVDGEGMSPLFRTYVERSLIGIDLFAIALLASANRLGDQSSLWLATIVAILGVQAAIAGTMHGWYTAAWYTAIAAAPVWFALFLSMQLRSANDQMQAFAADKKSLIEETMRDPLTGLLNRRGFDERFGDIMTESRLANKSVSIVLFDIDHFKDFNDEFGHPAGDTALRKIAEAVSSAAHRPADACCRVGGEEFAIVLGETDSSGGMTVAERVRSSVMRLRIPQAASIGKHLTVSVGVATADASVVVDGATLYLNADKALYKAKRLGRNRIASFEQRAVVDAPPLRAV